MSLRASDVEGLSIRELKQHLDDIGVAHGDCLEKSDLRHRLMQTVDASEDHQEVVEEEEVKAQVVEKEENHDHDHDLATVTEQEARWIEQLTRSNELTVDDAAKIKTQLLSDDHLARVAARQTLFFMSQNTLATDTPPLSDSTEPTIPEAPAGVVDADEDDAEVEAQAAVDQAAADWESDRDLIQQLVECSGLTPEHADDLKEKLQPWNEPAGRLASRQALHVLAGREGILQCPPRVYACAVGAAAKRLPSALIRHVGADRLLPLATWLADPSSHIEDVDSDFTFMGADHGGATALLHAAAAGAAGALRLLLREGASATAQDKHGRTALMRAAAAGHAECVASLLSHVNSHVGQPSLSAANGTEQPPDQQNIQPAPAAAAVVARAPAPGGCDSGGCDSGGSSAGSSAGSSSPQPADDTEGGALASSLAPDVVTAVHLLKAIDADGATALHLAAAGGHAGSVLSIMEHLTQLSDGGSPPPCEDGAGDDNDNDDGGDGWGWARAFGPPAAALLGRRRGRNVKGDTPLQLALDTHRKTFSARKSIGTLGGGGGGGGGGGVGAECGVDGRSNTAAAARLLSHPLAFRASNRLSGPVEGALDATLQRCCSGQIRPLHDAMLQAYTLTHTEDTDAALGRTALCWAAAQRSGAGTVRMLLAAGANAAHVDADGRTALVLAVRARAEECVSAMVCGAGGVEASPRSVHEAARSGAAGCLARLLKLDHLLKPALLAAGVAAAAPAMMQPAGAGVTGVAAAAAAAFPSGGEGAVPPAAPVRLTGMVTVCGLASEAGQKLNGRMGTISMFDAAKGRYCVVMNDDGGEALVKAANLKPAPSPAPPAAAPPAEAAPEAAVPEHAPSPSPSPPISPLLLESAEHRLTPYLAALSAGCAECALVLLCAGANPLAVDTVQQRSAVHLAAKVGSVDCLSIALMAAASARGGTMKDTPSAQHWLWLWRSRGQRRTRFCELRIDGPAAAAAANATANVAALGCGAKPGPTPPLFDAVAADSPECVRLLLEQGATLAARGGGGGGGTALHQAAALGHLKCVEALLGAAADVDGARALLKVAAGGLLVGYRTAAEVARSSGQAQCEAALRRPLLHFAERVRALEAAAAAAEAAEAVAAAAEAAEAVAAAEEGQAGQAGQAGQMALVAGLRAQLAVWEGRAAVGKGVRRAQSPRPSPHPNISVTVALAVSVPVVGRFSVAVAIAVAVSVSSPAQLPVEYSA
jgi:ankyrin repeat protein